MLELVTAYETEPDPKKKRHLLVALKILVDNALNTSENSAALLSQTSVRGFDMGA